MHIHIPYGHATLSANLDGLDLLGTLDIANTPALPDPAQALRDAIANPIGLSGPLLDAFRAGERVCIVVSDSFRYTAVEHILAALLATLAEKGIRDEEIAFLVSTGTHRGPTPEEARRILGADVYERFAARCFTHDAFDDSMLVEVGTTSRGTRVRVNRRAVECDRLILTGACVLHYFGGFGGGRKSLVPGLAAADTIAQNHARNLHSTENRLNPDVRIGALDGNPVAEDMLEACRLCRVDGIVNTVLNRESKIAGIFAGELDAAHRAAADFARGLFVVPIERRADLVIASAASAKNFIQSHKALFNAYQAVKPEGRIVFLAPAPEGFGGNKFREWISLGSRDAIIAALRKRAEINGQTALSTIEKATITLMLTELPDADVTLMGARKAATLQAAIDLARAELVASGVKDPTCYLMPSASYSVPIS